jgi:cysteine desulfuration protein SufE
VLTFAGDSDALIVKGLIAIAFMIYSGRPASEIAATDATPILHRLGLSDHLTPQRSNGFAAMVARMRTDARRALQDSAASGMAAR